MRVSLARQPPARKTGARAGGDGTRDVPSPSGRVYRSAMQRAEIIVVGGGLFGPAIAYGLARSGINVALLDAGAEALRAARGNFGLVWVQSKGTGVLRDVDWRRESGQLWTALYAEPAKTPGNVSAPPHR